MTDATEVQRRLHALNTRLDAVNRAWSVDNYEALLAFFVAIMPKVLEAERCTIFVVEPGSDRIWSKIGTGIRERQIEAPRDDSVVGRAVSTGQRVIENNLGQLAGFHLEADAQTGFETRNLVCAPIRSLTGHGVTGAVQVLNRRNGSGFSDSDGALLQDAADYLAMAIENITVNQEMLRISTHLNRELEHLRSAYLGSVPFVAESEAMRAVLDMVRMVSATPVDVFVQGENGTGKEVVARMIHENSDRRDRPFVAVNCASIPETLMESEFFGYEKGAYTGAVASRAGRFEEADGGVLFLDEVADMPLAIQAKFLRAMQEGEGSRLGSNRIRRYDLRLISASNRDLRAAVNAGNFREDLFYRLFAVEIHVPPLRERRADIGPLAQAFLSDVTRRFHKSVGGFSPAVMSLFERHPWPGNVRQLRREVERVVALAPPGASLSLELCSQEFRARDPGPGGSSEATLNIPQRVRALESELITRALEESAGNKARAAEILGITRQGLHKKLKRYELQVS